MHFMNPVPVMRLIEFVRAITTSDETLETARAFGESLGKRVIVSKDRAGFIVNMLLVPYLLEAIRMYESGFASREDIDLGMMLGTNHPMGPLTLLDYVGLDTTYYIANILYDELHEPKYAPPPLLKQMVTAGFLGRKSGRGFYDYDAWRAAAACLKPHRMPPRARSRGPVGVLADLPRDARERLCPGVALL